MIVVKRNGRYENVTDLVDDPDDFKSVSNNPYPCAHQHLNDCKRCAGCGRTLNEIELER